MRAGSQALLDAVTRELEHVTEIERRADLARQWLMEASTLLRTGKSARYVAFFLTEAGVTVALDETVALVSAEQFIQQSIQPKAHAPTPTPH